MLRTVIKAVVLFIVFFVVLVRFISFISLGLGLAFPSLLMVLMAAVTSSIAVVVALKVGD